VGGIGSFAGGLPRNRQASKPLIRQH